jgi:hypothetical protein
MLTQSMETTLRPQATTSPSPTHQTVTDACAVGDDVNPFPVGDLPCNGVVTTAAKREVGRVAGPNRGQREERGLSRWL